MDENLFPGRRFIRDTNQLPHAHAQQAEAARFSVYSRPPSSFGGGPSLPLKPSFTTNPPGA
jgi:hypothetical protein